MCIYIQNTNNILRNVSGGLLITLIKNWRTFKLIYSWNDFWKTSKETFGITRFYEYVSMSVITTTHDTQPYCCFFSLRKNLGGLVCSSVSLYGTIQCIHSVLSLYQLSMSISYILIEYTEL